MCFSNKYTAIFITKNKIFKKYSVSAVHYQTGIIQLKIRYQLNLFMKATHLGTLEFVEKSCESPTSLVSVVRQGL